MYSTISRERFVLFAASQVFTVKLFRRRDVPRYVRPSHKMQRTFLNLRKSVHLLSARALNNQAR